MISQVLSIMEKVKQKKEDTSKGIRKQSLEDLLTNPVPITVQNRSQRLLQTLAILSAIIAFSEGITLYATDHRQYSFFSLLVLIISSICFIIVRQGGLRLPYWIFFIIINTSVFLGIRLYGWSSGVFYFLFDLVPLIFFLSNLKAWEKWASFFLLSFFIIFHFVTNFTRIPIVEMETIRLQLINLVNAILAFSSLAALLRICYLNTARTEQDLIKANDTLSDLAQRDPLTNLLNRRSLLAMVHQDSQHSKMTGIQAAVIMGDIDNYKAVNDVYGHPAGDEILIQLSGVLKSSLRKQDLIARWGGEEFLIYLPGMDEEGLITVINKLRTNLQMRTFQTGTAEISISLTFGGVICGADESIEDSIKRADWAMYYGKLRGRDQAIIEQSGELKPILQG